MLALAFSFSSVSAEDATTTPPFGPGGRNGFNVEKKFGQERAQEVRATNATGEREIPGLEMRKKARTMIINGMLRRAESILRISEKMETRIEKLEDEGIDTGEALELIEDAQDKVAEAKAHFEEAKEAVEDGGELAEILEHVRLGKEALKEAHGLLVQALKEIKDGLAEVDDSEEEEEDEEEDEE